MRSFDNDIVEDIQRLLERPIILIGMMGAGKTRIGRQLSKILNLDFFDSDDEIEAAAGMEISEIFERFGESYFRDGERRVIERLVDGSVRVIATGGGAIMTEEVSRLVWDNAISVWVRADIEIMVERTQRKDNRPLLKNGDAREILTKLAEDRYPVYEKADIVIDSHNGPSEAIINQSLEKIHKYLNYEQVKAS